MLGDYKYVFCDGVDCFDWMFKYIVELLLLLFLVMFKFVVVELFVIEECEEVLFLKFKVKYYKKYKLVKKLVK